MLFRSKGFVSKAISEKAGRKIQDEIRSQRMRLAPDGHVAETKAYNLNCQAVYHTVCASKIDNPSASQVGCLDH